LSADNLTNPDLTQVERNRIIKKWWPRVPAASRGRVEGMLNDVADLVLSKYLGIHEPAPADEIIYPDLHTADLEITTFRKPDAGGFSFGYADIGVRITHLPTGLQAEAWEDRSQYKNKAVAYAELKRKVALHVRQPDPDPKDPHPDKTDAELGFAYRMMLRAAHNGLVVNFISGDISLPKKG
jgi:hypothetical protein